MNAADHPIPVKEMLLHAFQQHQENPDMIVLVAGQILCAATQAPKLNFGAASSGRPAVAIGDDEAFEVGLPHDSVSTFRTLMARFGVICNAAAQKRSLAGEVKTLKRAGLVADKTFTERKDPGD